MYNLIVGKIKHIFTRNSTRLKIIDTENELNYLVK